MGKKEPHIRVLEGFVIDGGINQEVKPAGFKRPYFAKQCNNWAHSPHEQKRRALRVFSIGQMKINERIGALFGLISPDLSKASGR
jgi:hypothetical protein